MNWAVNPMIDRFVTGIRQHTRSEWQGWFLQRLQRVRLVIQDSGEKSLLLGLGLGILIVLFPKLFIAVGLLGLLVFLIIIAVAEE